MTGINKQQIQKEERIGKLEEDCSGLKLWFLKICYPNSFSKFIFIVSFDITLRNKKNSPIS